MSKTKAIKMTLIISVKNGDKSLIIVPTFAKISVVKPLGKGIIENIFF